MSLHDGPASRMLMGDISDDILLHVFSYLDAISLCKVRRVCHRWHNLSTDDILWKHKLICDAKRWKHISHTTHPDKYMAGAADTEASDNQLKSNLQLYLAGSPDIQKFKKAIYEQTTLHHLTDFLRNFLPTKRYSIGVDAIEMDGYGKGQSFFSKLLSFDASNIFQHCGQFPGRFMGHGGGFLFKYKRHMLELCLMYVAQKNVRDSMSAEERAKQLEVHMSSTGYKQLLESLDAYIHTVDSCIAGDSKVSETEKNLEHKRREIELIDRHLKPGTPILVLSCRMSESDECLQPYHVSKALHLEKLQRPWMIAELSSQMIYRDIADPMDWLMATAKPH